MMKSRIIVTALLLLGLTGAVTAQQGSPNKRSVVPSASRFTEGRAVFRDIMFDFGKVPQNSLVSKTFYVINEGTDTLEIVKIKPG